MNNNLILKALELGATDFDVSEKKDKRFYVVYDGKKIHFGSKTGKTFIDHKDETKKDNWYLITMPGTAKLKTKTDNMLLI